MDLLPSSEDPAIKQAQPYAKSNSKGRKEYLADALLIVFSVLLALLLNEIRNNWQDKKQTQELLHNIRLELVNNKKLLENQHRYHLLVLHNIDSALANESYQQQILQNGELHLSALAPEGIMLEDFDWTAWETAKNNNITSKVDQQTMSLLNEISRQHLRIEKIEDKMADVLLVRESRKPENRRETLILMKDNYKGWSVDRTPGLLKTYEEAIEKLKAY